MNLKEAIRELLDNRASEATDPADELLRVVGAVLDIAEEAEIEMPAMDRDAEGSPTFDIRAILEVEED